MRNAFLTALVAAGLWATLTGWATLSGPADAPQAGLGLRSAGCGKAAAPGSVIASARDGRQAKRTYLVEVPGDYAATRAYAVTFVFHASGGTSAQSASWGLQRAAGAAEASLFVFPQGSDFQGQGIGWDDRSDGYDLPLFDRMLGDLEAAYCIDTQRVFVAGFSWGGDFAIALACRRGSAIRAVAANSSTDEFTDKRDFKTYEDLPCPGSRHPAMRFVHAADGDPQYPAPLFATTAALLRHVNACGATSTPAATMTPGQSCVSFDGCHSATVECTFDHALGHVLPPNWAADTWKFFSQQSPPAP